MIYMIFIVGKIIIRLFENGSKVFSHSAEAQRIQKPRGLLSK